MLAASSIGIYRSTDAGQTWTLVRSGEATAVFFDPAQPGIAWAAREIRSAATTNGVYRSTDSGATWTLVRGDTPNTLPAASLMGRIQVVNVPTSPNSAYAIVTTPITGPGPICWESIRPSTRARTGLNLAAFPISARRNAGMTWSSPRIPAIRRSFSLAETF